MIKLGTFFSGIGAVEKALKNIDIEYDLQFFSEIDKYAIKSYTAIHNETEDKNVGDISNLKGEDLPYCDMWFGGFPCQDISIAGNLAGWESNTRSSLGWEMIRLAREVEEKPKYIIFENVKNITSKRFKNTLRLFKSDLEELGYYLYDKVLNAKDYGIPQNRERYFLIASLEKQDYEFPEKEELKTKLRDLLEDEVDEKFYLSDKMIAYLTGENQKDSKFPQGERFRQTLEKTNIELVEDEENKIHIRENTKKGYKEAYEGDGIYINRPHQKRGVVQKDMIQTLKTSGNDLGVITKGLRIRKLTPKECFRLMGFSDEDFNKASQVNSNSQLYKQAGNSIVVNVLERILEGFL